MTKLTKKETIERMRKVKEIETNTMNIWLKSGAIKEDYRGQENIYFTDQFGHRYFCKCL